MRALLTNAVGAALVLGAAAPAVALDPSRAPSQYVIRRWGADALRSNAVYSILQTGDRYLWIGTSAGLLRYDGSRFVAFNARNTPLLGGNGVSRLSERPGDALFIGTTGGDVIQYRECAFATTVVPAGSASITSLLAARNGALWASSLGRNIRYWMPDGASMDSIVQTQACGALIEDAKGGVWIGTRDKGLFEVRGTDVTLHATGEDAVQALLFDREETLWIGTSGGLLRRSKGGAIERVAELGSENVTAFVEDRDGNLWVGTGGGGLSRRAGGRWARLTRSFDGLSDDDVRALAEDHEGNLWVGTADGLNRLSNGSFITYGRAEGLPEDAITAVAPGRNGAVWAGTDTGTLLRLDAGKIERHELPGQERGRDPVLSLHEMQNGDTWYTLDSRRLLRLRNGRVIDERAKLRPDSKREARAFLDGDDGEPLFFVAQIGLARLDAGARMFTPALPGGPESDGGRTFPRFPHHVFRDPDGGYWLCDRLGAARYKDGRWKLFTDSNGLPHERVRWGTVDAEDRTAVWLATVGGLAYIKGHEVRAVRVQEGLPEGSLRVVLDDRRGHLWVGSSGNIFRLDKRELHDLFAGRQSQVSPRVFDTSDGLRTTELRLGNAPAFRGEDGRLWFATAKGIAVADPERLPVNAVPPAVHIEAVSIDDVAYDVRKPIAAPPGRGDLQVQYTGLSYTMPERVRFRYRLDGHDDRWIDAGDRRAAYYTNLRPGRYEFRVSASNNDGVWNEQGTGVGLYVAPHFYETPWFAVLAVVFAVSAGLAAHQVRVRYLKAREKVLALRVEEGLSQIKVLRGMLPTCSSCKKIRDEHGSWSAIESYIRDHSEANFSHGMCPDCLATLYPEYHARL